MFFSLQFIFSEKILFFKSSISLIIQVKKRSKNAIIFDTKSLLVRFNLAHLRTGILSLLLGYFIICFNFYLFTYIFGCIGSLLLRCAGFSLRWLLLLQSTGSRCVGFSSCGTRAQLLHVLGYFKCVRLYWGKFFVSYSSTSEARVGKVDI